MSEYIFENAKWHVDQKMPDKISAYIIYVRLECQDANQRYISRLITCQIDCRYIFVRSKNVRMYNVPGNVLHYCDTMLYGVPIAFCI